MDEKDTIESLLDLNDDEIKQLYNGWDKGDCSLAYLAYTPTVSTSLKFYGLHGTC